MMSIVWKWIEKKHGFTIVVVKPWQNYKNCIQIGKKTEATTRSAEKNNNKVIGDKERTIAKYAY